MRILTITSVQLVESLMTLKLYLVHPLRNLTRNVDILKLEILDFSITQFADCSIRVYKFFCNAGSKCSIKQIATWKGLPIPWALLLPFYFSRSTFGIGFFEDFRDVWRISKVFTQNNCKINQLAILLTTGLSS